MADIVTDGELHTVKRKLSSYNWWSGVLNSIRFDFFDYSIVGDTMVISSIKLTK